MYLKKFKHCSRSKRVTNPSRTVNLCEVVAKIVTKFTKDIKMFKEGSHPMFPCSEQEKQAIQKILGLKESAIQEEIDAILDWFGKQPHLVDAGLPERSFVERMLINAKGSREKTKKRIDSFYKHRSLAPDMIQNRNDFLHSNRDIFTYYRIIAVPKLLDFKRVTIIQFTDPDPNNFTIDVILRNALMMGDIRLRHDYILGDIWVLDIKNTSIGHFLRVNPVVFSKAAHIFLDGIGIRLHETHVIGAPSYLPQLLQFFGKFAKPKIMERIKIHESTEELHKYIPKEYLPKDFDGDLPSFEYFKGEYEKLLRAEDTKKLIAECSKQISDESKRPGADLNEELLNGTFKKLDLD